MVSPHHEALAGFRAEAAELILKAKRSILLVGDAVHTTKSGDAVRELALKMNCPVIQTSGGTSYIKGLEDRTSQYVFSDASIEAVEASDLVLALATELGEPHALRALATLARRLSAAQVDPGRAGRGGNRRQSPD